MFEESAKFLSPENLEILREYAKKNFIMKASMFLSDDFLEAEKLFETSVFRKVSEFQMIVGHTIPYFNICLGYMGEIYAENYLSEGTKKNIENMVLKFKEVYKTKINNADWLSESAKKKACLKLDAMKVSIGYPNDRGDLFQDIIFKSSESGGSFFYNVCQVNKRINEFNNVLLGASVSNVSWYMPEYTVNAFYDFTKNKLKFPQAFCSTHCMMKTLHMKKTLVVLGLLLLMRLAMPLI